jgi:signal transduction histidine kinase
MVAAVSVPMLVADYRPLIEAYGGLPVDETLERLSDDATLLSVTELLAPIAASDAWLRLYGDPLSDAAPSFTDRQLELARYPDLRESLILQVQAPFVGATTVIREHTVPTLGGTDVTVRSHWQAAGTDGMDRYARIVVVDLDVTDLRRAEHAALNAAEAQSRLIGSVSHELRSPLTALAGSAQLLDGDWDALDDDTRRELVRTMAMQAEDLSGIVEDLLAESALDRSTLRVAHEPVDLAEVLAGLDLAGYEVELAPDTKVMGDSLRIRQIIRNLVSNAARYGGRRRTLHAEPDDGFLVVRVADDGPGISAQARAHLFEPFNTGTASGSIGLGLAISRDLAQAMGGDLRVDDSAADTTFELLLPLSAASPSS